VDPGAPSGSPVPMESATKAMVSGSDPVKVRGEEAAAWVLHWVLTLPVGDQVRDLTGEEAGPPQSQHCGA